MNIRYRVDLLAYYGGRFEFFWTKKGAYKFADKNKHNWLWVDVIDRWGNKDRIKDTDIVDYFRTKEGE